MFKLRMRALFRHVVSFTIGIQGHEARVMSKRACVQVERKALPPHPQPQAFAETPFATPPENIMEDIHWQLRALRGGM